MPAGAKDDAPDSWGQDLWAIVKLDHDMAAALAATEAAHTDTTNKSNNNNSNNNDPQPPAVTWMKANCYPSEPIFVPRPDGVDEGT